VRHEKQRTRSRVIVAEVVLEQPCSVEASLKPSAQSSMIRVERLVGLVDVAGRRGLEAEGEIVHTAFPRVRSCRG